MILNAHILTYTISNTKIIIKMKDTGVFKTTRKCHQISIQFFMQH